MIKILHVEDDADIREIAQLALGLSGDFEVVQSASGEEALLMVQAFIPDVLTARAQNSEVEELRGLGAAEVISKPFDPMSLGDQIKAALKAYAEA